MTAPANGFKAALLSGRATRGIWLDLASPLVAEMAGHAGFDWALVDAEHGPNGIGTIQAQLQALSATPTPAIVRLPMGEAWAIKQVLDLGAQSLMVPMVETADEARAIVAATRYPPDGIRGVGYGVARSGLWGMRADYAATAGAEICVVAQVESQRGLDAIDAIAAVDGIDCVFVGPADLAADMGHPGAPDHPEVTDAIDRAIARIAAAGKAPGLFGLDPAHFVELERKGIRMLASACDAVLLSRAMRAVAGQGE